MLLHLIFSFRFRFTPSYTLPSLTAIHGMMQRLRPGHSETNSLVTRPEKLPPGLAIDLQNPLHRLALEPALEEDPLPLATDRQIGGTVGVAEGPAQGGQQPPPSG